MKEGVIFVFVADLMFRMPLERGIGHLGYRPVFIEQADDVAAGVSDGPEAPGELLSGRGAALFEQLTTAQPVLLIFDLNNPAIPWSDWIAALNTSPATRRIPILCFGSHVEAETMQRARAAGADGVVARSRLAAALPELIQQYARQFDPAGIELACTDPLSPLALKGIEAFNRGDYYLAHEELELAWKADEGPGRELYRAILQIAVAYYQIERGNYRGALKMFLRVRQWLSPLPDSCRGVNLGQLKQDANLVHQALVALGPEQVGEVERGLFRPVSFDPTFRKDH